MNAIDNINEFYSDHYFAAVLPEDMRKAVDSGDDQILHALRRGEVRALFRVAQQEKRAWINRFQDTASLQGSEGLDCCELSQDEETAASRASLRAWRLAILRTLGFSSSNVSVSVALDEDHCLPALAAEDGVAVLELPDGDDCFNKLAATDLPKWSRVLSRLFARDDGPSRLLVWSGFNLYLLDRSKWMDRRALRFDFASLYDEESDKEWRMTLMLKRESLYSAACDCLLDELDGKAVKNAYAVSSSLKDALREGVELLGNEYVYALRQGTYEGSEEDTAATGPEIARECVRFMYRLLFCFYLEARLELEFLPMDNECYAHGYSLEWLREMELAPMETEVEENGLFFDDSLRMLFTLIYSGREAASNATIDFSIAPLKSHLFDPNRTPHLNKIRFRNITLQRVIRLMSLGQQGKRTGRISYATLGLNQLGTVYESLLSYTGFFAEKRLYEVKPKNKPYDPRIHAYFVGAEEFRDNYVEGERVVKENGNFIIHEQGDFIYRIGGLNRKDSAAYYTPEGLTRLTVRHALKELLQGKTADDILKLKICEPAVGSAAFLNEALNQLAAAYVRLKRKEATDLPLENEWLELQRVKTYIANRNIYGADRNDMSLELSELALWLNTIHKGSCVPWFGNRLRRGNAIVGCKRHSWAPHLLRGGRSKTSARPSAQPIPYDHARHVRPHEGIYHWLVPDEGMAVYDDKVVKKIHKGDVARANKWRKDFCCGLTDSEIDTLERLTEKADRLWEEHDLLMSQLERDTADELTVWPHPLPVSPRRTSTQQKDALLRKATGPDTPYAHLKLAMDYWCALWFWPVEEVRKLPSRREFLNDLDMLLGTDANVPAQGAPSSEGGDPSHGSLKGTLSNVDELILDNERLAIVRQVADVRAFFHWELEFTTVFAEKGGFDLIVGKPQWMKLEWEEKDLLDGINPLFAIRKGMGPAKLAELRQKEFETRPGFEKIYAHEACAVGSLQNILNAAALYPLLTGGVNPFKNYITRSWEVVNPEGVIGFIHPEGVYDYVKGGALRRELYPRLRAHFRFMNATNLFAEIGASKIYSVNIYGSPREKIDFINISNLFDPSTVDASLCMKSSAAPVEGLKSETGKWSVAAHPDRVIHVTENELELFSQLFEETGTPAREARLAVVHAQGLLRPLRLIAQCARKRSIGSLGERVSSAELWHEKKACEDGILRQVGKDHFPDSPKRLVLSGPHIYVANPCFRTAQAVYKSNSSYDILDLESLPDDYLPRAVFEPACDWPTYASLTPDVTWETGKKLIDCDKLAFRVMLSHTGERTMISALLCAGSSHVHGLRSLTTQEPDDLLMIAAMMQSLVGDFFIVTTGADATVYQWKALPLLDAAPQILARVLALNCLTSWYGGLWKKTWREDFRALRWYADDPRLPQDFWSGLTPEWSRSCALRTAYARRWAMCELDVLVARAIGLDVKELCDICRLQFPVLKQNEADTWYDRHGRVIFTRSRSLPSSGISSEEWNKLHADPRTYRQTIQDSTRPGGSHPVTTLYEPPFTRCDREKDYRKIWERLDAEG